MPAESSQVGSELLWAQECQQGHAEALGRIQEKCHAALANILIARGASRTETEDLLADLWADCVPGADDRPSLLEKFSGKCTLQGWLATVATRRWIDLKRRQARRVEVAPPNPQQQETTFFERVPTPAAEASEDALVNLLRDSLQAAFALCSPETMTLLRLRYLHGISQRELVRMLGWHESKVSRALTQAMKEIEDNTMRELKKRDPWVELTWQDFLDLCQTQQIGFL